MITAPDDPNGECPRCGGAFHCGVAGPGPCACGRISLTPALLADLRARYDRCLCFGCLAELASAPASSSVASPH